jgi:protease II
MSIEPPEAKQIPSLRTFHGDAVIDEYAWLADKDDPDTIDYLTAENAYTDAVTAHLAPLREQIFTEIKARTQESDLSVPVRKGGWWHYSRTVEGKQYAVHCRRAVRPGEVIPPIPADGKPLDGEEELLDGNELAVGHDFFSLGTFRTSPDQRWLAYSTDFAGNERFTLRIKDLATAGRDSGHLRRLRVVPGRLHRLLHDCGRRLAAVPGLAAPDRHLSGGGHHGVRGAGRALPRLREPDPQRELPDD